MLIIFEIKLWIFKNINEFSENMYWIHTTRTHNSNSSNRNQYLKGLNAWNHNLMEMTIAEWRLMKFKKILMLDKREMSKLKKIWNWKTLSLSIITLFKVLSVYKYLMFNKKLKLIELSCWTKCFMACFMIKCQLNLNVVNNFVKF